MKIAHVKSSGGSRRLVVGLALAVLCYSMLQMMVVPTLPAMAADLDTSPANAAWLVSAFLLCTAVSTPLLGRLGDVLGRTRVLLAVLSLSAVGSIMAMSAPSFEILLAARMLQGLGGATFPLAFGHARDLLPPEKVPVVVGLISGGFGVGGSLGLVLAGPISDASSWRWIFSAGLVTSVAAIVCLWPTRHLDRPRPRRLDLGGAVAVSLGLLCVLLAVSQQRSWGFLEVIPLGVLGVVILLLWARRARRQDDPVFDVGLLRDPGIWPAHLAAALLGFAMYANGYLVPLLVQHPEGLDADVTTSSLVLLPALVIGLASGYLGGRLGRSGPTIPLALGALVMTVGFALAAAYPDHLGVLVMGVTLSHGLGLNIVLATAASMVTLGAPADRVGEATGINTAARTIGGSLGSQVVAALVASSAASVASGFTLGFVVCGISSLLIAILALGANPHRRRDVGVAPSTLPSESPPT